MVGNAISKFFIARISIDVPTLSDYPDVFALAITLLLTGEWPGNVNVSVQIYIELFLKVKK